MYCTDYCLKMDNGQYYDPWNPWCGYIECLDGAATRRCCRTGSWMGMGTGPDDNMFMTKDRMCRRALVKKVNDRRCAETTEYDLCGKTKQLEANSTVSGSSR